jgi:hypothetical protein
LTGDIAPFDDAQGRLRQGGRFHAFSQNVAQSATFCEKDKKSTMLPPADQTSIG